MGELKKASPMKIRKVLALMVRILSNSSQATPVVPKPWSPQDETQHFAFGGLDLTYKIFTGGEESLAIKFPEHRKGGDENRQALLYVRNGVRCSGVEFEIGVSHGFQPLILSLESELPDRVSAVWHACKRAVEEGKVDALWDERGYYAPRRVRRHSVRRRVSKQRVAESDYFFKFLLSNFPLIKSGGERMRKYMENNIQNLIGLKPASGSPEHSAARNVLWLLILVIKNGGDFACDQIN